MLRYKEVLFDANRFITKDKLTKHEAPFLIVFLGHEAKIIGNFHFKTEEERDKIFDKIAEGLNATSIQ